MEYRRLGRTELRVSLLGVGGGYVMLLEDEEGRCIYRRAMELGVNYFDGRYGFTSRMLSPLIQAEREQWVVVTKTAETTKEGALARIDEDLEELGSDYIDVFYLRTYNQEMREAHFAPGGSIEGLLEARDKGKIRFLGLAGHSDLSALADGVDTGLIDAVIFPLNVVRRDALDVLVPACQAHDVGMVVMKPVNVGLVPADVCVRWLANQPIHVMVPGVNSVGQLELDAGALDRPCMALSAEEEAEAEAWRAQMDDRTCRICDRVCQVVCEPKLQIDWLLYHNVFYNELRVLGPERFMAHPWAPWVKGSLRRTYERNLASLRSCTQCRKCEQVCPYGLPVVDMLEQIKEDHVELLGRLEHTDWDTAYADALSPFGPSASKRRS